MQYISLLSTIITIIFILAVLGRYRRKGGAHLLLWSIGLVFYGLGTFTEVILALAYSGLVLKVWYLTGAMLTAAWLGQGSVSLLIRRGRIAQGLTVVLAVVSLAALGLVLAAPLTGAEAAYNTAQPASEQYKAILERSSGMILLTVLLNIYGTLTLVGGAIYSAYLFWRKKVLLNRVVGNILIAAGALLPASAGFFIQAGLVDWLYISEFLGVIVMYLGFVQATASLPERREAPLSSPVQ